LNIQAEEWAELMAKVKQANKRIENQPVDDNAIPNNWQELQARDMEELANEDFSEPNQEGEFAEELRIHNKWERI